MPSLEWSMAAAIIVSLAAYSLLGGADYGGGVWDLLASGRRARSQRELIATMLGPIWEANHVWLILVVVVLFTAFPPAFAAIAIALHVPLTLVLVGIILRGAAFVFRSYDRRDDNVQRRWGTLFAVASLVTPYLLGVSAGTIASGQLPAGTDLVLADFFLPWLRPFPLAVGALAIVLFSFLAAVYLALAAREASLSDDFRARALAAGAASAAVAIVVFLLARDGAPLVWNSFMASWWGWPLQAIAFGCWLGALRCLWRRRYIAARIFSAGTVTAILIGWGLAQMPFVVPPALTIHNAAAPRATLELLAAALAVGAAVLVPSFVYLFRVFRSP